MLEQVDFPRLGDERSQLMATLHNTRVVMEWKLAGVSEEEARRALVPSGTSLLGLISHLTRVELWWFHHFTTNGTYPLDEPLASWWRDAERAMEDDDDAFEWQVPPAETVASVLDRYERAVKVSDAIAAAYPLEHAPDRERSRTLRGVLIHMIDETARHAGHADIIRELIDGVTGYLPNLD